MDGVLLTMHSQTLLNQQVAGELLENFPEMVVKPAIRRNVRLAEAPSHGVPIHLHDPSSPGGEGLPGSSNSSRASLGIILDV